MIHSPIKYFIHCNEWYIDLQQLIVVHYLLITIIDEWNRNNVKLSKRRHSGFILERNRHATYYGHIWWVFNIWYVDLRYHQIFYYDCRCHLMANIIIYIWNNWIYFCICIDSYIYIHMLTFNICMCIHI